MKRMILSLAGAASMAAVIAATARVDAVGNAPVVPNTGVADLIVRSDVLRNHWLVRSEDLPADFCSVQEGEVSPGVHTLLRFTVTTPNIGTADVFVGDPNEHVEAGDGLFEFATCHNHYHFRHYATYELIDGDGNVWRAAKRGFCMLDTDPNPQWLPGLKSGPREYNNCGAIGIPGFQGISAGWSDTYNFHLGGQYFVLDGGDHQDPVPPGQYVIRITVNPPFIAGLGEACPHTDTLGYCHQLPESDYTNNIGEVTINIPDHVGRSGVGPEKGAPHLKEEPIER